MIFKAQSEVPTLFLLQPIDGFPAYFLGIQSADEPQVSDSRRGARDALRPN